MRIFPRSVGTRRGIHRHRRTAGFTLVELLTVIFIISLLIGILIPSISAARTAAKRRVTEKNIQSISVGLEMFKDENASEFPQTNGYPPSYAHPPISGANFQPHLGEFPFLPNRPQAFGAHWLPAMLIGPDALGYIKRRTVPTRSGLNAKPEEWYTPDPLSEGTILERSALYADPGNLRLLRTQDLPGRRNPALFSSWSESAGERATESLPVIADGFEQPILYYVANRHGRTTNMVEDLHDQNNNYPNRGPQQDGTPYYFHQDNVGFTGTQDAIGWDFNGPHPLADSGATLTARQLVEEEYRQTFARYILDRRIYQNLATQTDVPVNSPLRPVNADTYLLISAGPDGRFGTTDDVSNLPPVD